MKHIYFLLILCSLSTIVWGQNNSSNNNQNSSTITYDITDVIELLLDYDYISDTFYDFSPGGYSYRKGHFHNWNDWSSRHTTFDYIKNKLDEKVIRSILISKYYTDTVSAIVLDSAVVMAQDAFYNAIDSATVLVNNSQQLVLDSATVLSTEAFINAVDSANVLSSLAQQTAIDSAVVLSNNAFYNSLDSATILVNNSQQLVLDSATVLSNEAFINAVDSAKLYSQELENSLTKTINDSCSQIRASIGQKLEQLTVNENSYWGIGTVDPEYELDVAGTIRAEEIIVESGNIVTQAIIVEGKGNTADFVFEEDYELRELSEVESYINANKHLPEIPSASEMEAAGVNLAQMNKLLLQKVEELTLYVIDQKKKSMLKNQEIDQMKLELDELRSLVNQFVSEK